MNSTRWFRATIAAAVCHTVLIPAHIASAGTDQVSASSASRTANALNCSNVLDGLELRASAIRAKSFLMFSQKVYTIALFASPGLLVGELVHGTSTTTVAILDILYDGLPEEMPSELRSVLDPALTEKAMRKVVSAYRGIAKGDRIVVDFEPGLGTRLSINGIPVIVDPGAGLMDRLLGSWLGVDPVSTDLRRRLLAGERLPTLIQPVSAPICDDREQAVPGRAAG
jgi:hypothetical protein